MSTSKKMIIVEIKAPLNLFMDKVPDLDSNRLVYKFCNEKEKWIRAHGLFATIRNRNLKAIKQGNKLKEFQYNFEEVCAKTFIL